MTQRFLSGYSVGLLLAGLLAPAAHAQIVLATNLTNSSNGTVGGYSSTSTFVATEFSTDASHVSIVDVMTKLATNTGTASASIYTNNSGQPGTNTGIVFSTSTSTGTVTFTAQSGPTLSANTDYWLVFSGTGSATFSATGDTSGTGPGFVHSNTLASSNLGSTWSSNSGMGQYMYLEVDSTTAVPEPTTYAAFAGLAALGLAAWRRRRVVG